MCVCVCARIRIEILYFDVVFRESGTHIIEVRFFEFEKTALGNLVIDCFWTLDQRIKTNGVVHIPRKKFFATYVRLCIRFSAVWLIAY